MGERALGMERQEREEGKPEAMDIWVRTGKGKEGTVMAVGIPRAFTASVDSVFSNR